MKKILVAVLTIVMLVSCASCAKKEEAKEELYTVNIYNRSGVTLQYVGIKNRENGNVAAVEKLEDGKKATLSNSAKLDATTGLPNLSLVYKLEDGSEFESVLMTGEKTTDITITADGSVQDGAPKE